MTREKDDDGNDGEEGRTRHNSALFSL